MMKTTTAQAASTERSAVGLLRPVKLIRFETTLVEKRAATKGIMRSKRFPPVLLLTRFVAVSTRSSATAWRFPIFSTLRFLVRNMQSPVMIAMTSQETRMVSVIRISPRTGMPVGMRKKIFAPEISKFINYFSPPSVSSVLFLPEKIPRSRISVPGKRRGRIAATG